MSPSAVELIHGLQQSLTSQGIDYEAVIDAFGQVRASEERTAGRQFSFADHVRGLVFAQLSSQRPWKPIAENRERITSVFLDFDRVQLEAIDPSHVVDGLRRLRCGNRRDKYQIAALSDNITTLQRIADVHGSLDAFVVSADPETVALVLSAPGRYKLREVGFALAMEYLKNVGVRASKPDVHVCRALGAERLAFLPDSGSPSDAYEMVAALATAAGTNPTYLDNLLWLFCAKDYGSICGSTPRCAICHLAASCQFPARVAT